MSLRGALRLPCRPLQLLCLTLLLISLGGVAQLQRVIDHRRGSYGKIEDVLYLPSPDIIKKLCLGFEGLVADIYWTRVVQYYGRRRMDQVTRYDLLGPLLNITVTLDPQLLIAYRFGAIFLAQKPPGGPGRAEEALHLIRRGIVTNPQYWRLWQDLGFIYYWDLKDYASAARAFETGSRQAGAYSWMKVMAASIYAQGGQPETSRFLWQEIYRTAENDLIRKNAEGHLAALQAEEDLRELTKILNRYARAEARPASSWNELVARGYLRGLPRDPWGYPYVLKPGGQVGLSPQSKIDLSLLH